MFGFIPSSRKEIENAIDLDRSKKLWNTAIASKPKSPAYFLVRTPDNPQDIHVSFELCGKEYNYGPSKREGFEAEMRVPLPACA